jgi:RND family efflux transporter MFP subunit
MKKSRKNVWITLILILALAAGGVAVSRQMSASAAEAEAADIETALVQRGDLSLAIDASGSLSPRMEIELGFTSGGQVAEVFVAEGERVTAGQPLVKLDTQDLEWQVEQARLAVDIAELDLSDARDDYWENDEPTQRAIARLEQAKVTLQQTEWRLEQATLVAPVGGVVTTLSAAPGEIANNGQTVIVLTDLDDLEVEVNVDETEVARLVEGMEVGVSLDAFPGSEFNGRVTYIEPSANVQSGVVLYLVTVELDSTGDLPLRPGMTANVVFTLEKRANTLVVPFRAVETEGGQAYVTRVTAAGSERVAVTLGLVTDTQVEILEGLAEGDVVTVYANPSQDTSLMRSNPMFGGGQ